MSVPRTVAVLVGSLRKASYSRKLAHALAELAPEGLKLQVVEIGALPFYNEDLETDAPPPAWTAFREQVGAADAVLYITPEYNRSVPAVLKNAIDVGSRPYGKSVLGKPSAVVSSSPGGIGGFGANHHLRQSLAFLGAPILQMEVYLGAVNTFFDDTGALTKADSRAFLQKFVDAFAAHIERNLA